jgi:putative hemolysin
LSDAIITAHLDPHTRFPICEDNDFNQVLGYVNFKEMIYRQRTNPTDASLRGIIRPVHFVEPQQPATELLRVFVERHEHMAIIQDHGRTLGLVTLEDVIEELVGELEDEFDRLPRMFHDLSGGTWMVGGGIPVTELADKLKLTLPDDEGSISAWLIRRFGHVPKPNEIYATEEAEFMVRRTRRGKIFEVSVTPTGTRTSSGSSEYQNHNNDLE